MADVNECLEEDAICGPHCNCTNSIGSYFCDCVEGYRLDNSDVIASASNPCIGAHSLGRTCTPDLIAASDRLKRRPCPPMGFSLTDIDECYEQPGICGLNTVCTNIPGTFFCSCPDGFYPSTGIFWIVGTSFCQSEQSRVWRLSNLRESMLLYYLLITRCVFLIIFSDLDEVVGKIVPREVKPTFSSFRLRD